MDLYFDKLAIRFKGRPIVTLSALLKKDRLIFSTPGKNNISIQAQDRKHSISLSKRSPSKAILAYKESLRDPQTLTIPECEKNTWKYVKHVCRVRMRYQWMSQWTSAPTARAIVRHRSMPRQEKDDAWRLLDRRDQNRTLLGLRTGHAGTGDHLNEIDPWPDPTYWHCGDRPIPHRVCFGIVHCSHQRGPVGIIGAET